MTLDHAQCEAKRIIGNGVARAYGFRRSDDFVDDCPRCHGDGTIPVAGFSINPGSGVLVRDPQETRDETCPDCHGTGEAA